MAKAEADIAAAAHYIPSPIYFSILRRHEAFTDEVAKFATVFPLVFVAQASQVEERFIGYAAIAPRRQQ